MNNTDMPAMPHTEYDRDGNMPKGLTKREHFAGLAMQGNMAARTVQWEDVNVKYMASMCIQIADELLKQLEDK